MGPYFSNSYFIELGFSTLIFVVVLLTLLVIIPGFFIWLSLALIGNRRPLLKCGIANLVAFVASAFITFVLSMIPPLILLSPLVFILLYLWVFKELLDLGWLHAFIAVVLSVGCVMLLSAIFGFLFAFFKPLWIPHRF
uniref:Uncharacterized protein n=1 Tax=Archaeoglobus fulgidus TaxID=2234 RepID=A0A7C3MBM6_ARCFL